MKAGALAAATPGILKGYRAFFFNMNGLHGLRVAVTRAATQAEELAEPLRAAGATVLLCPLIRIEPRQLDDELRSTLQNAADFEWIVFTSVNGVEQFARVWQDVQGTSGAAPMQRVACVGPATAAAAARHGYRVQVVPQSFHGAAVAEAIVAHGLTPGRQILLPRAAGGGEALPRQLQEHGAIVRDLELYRSVADQTGAELLRNALSAAQIDLVTFTSGSAIRYFVEYAGMRPGIRMAVIGPSTAAVAKTHGLRVDIVAPNHTITAMVAAIRDYYAAARG